MDTLNLVFNALNHLQYTSETFKKFKKIFLYFV